jgi:hypothetical protein
MVTVEANDQFDECTQTEGIDQQCRCAGASLRAWRGPVRPVPRHRERTAIGIAKAQCLDARDDSDLQNDEPLPAQRVKRMDDLSGPQSPIGPECSSLGVCQR